MSAAHPYHGDCKEHRYRPYVNSSRSIGRVTVEVCNNCLSVMVVQKRDTDSEPTRTEVEMKDSAYSYIK